MSGSAVTTEGEAGRSSARLLAAEARVAELEAEGRADRVSVEDAVRATEQRLAGVLESLPDAFVSFDAELRYTYVNAAAERLQSARREDLLGKDVRAVYPDAESYKTIALYERLLREGGDVTATSHHAGFDRWVEVRAFRTPEGVSVFFKDVTPQVKAERALRESEQRFRLALHNAPVSVAVLDRSLRYVWAYNQRSIRSEQVVGRRDADLFRPAEAARLTASARRVLEEGVELRDQLWLERPNGPMYVDVCWEPIRDEHGEVVGVACATIDLTERKHAETALRRHELVVQQTLDAILFVRRSDGRILDANPAALAAYGCGREELLALSVAELRAPETRAAVEAELREAGLRGVLFETVHVRRDGTPFPVEVSWRVASEDTLVGVVRDISARRDAEARARAERERAERRAAELDAVFNSLAEPVVVTDARGAILRVNPAHRRLFTAPDPSRLAEAEESVRRLAFQPIDDGGPTSSPGARALAGEIVSGVLQRIAGPDGAPVDLSVSAAPIRTREGVVGMVCTFTDVTARVRAEEALKEADRRKDEFLAVLSHELRNPLAPITSSLHVLDRAPHDSPPARRARAVLARQVAHLSALVGDLLDVTRIGSNKVRLAKERLDLVEIARRAVEDARSLFDRAGVDLALVTPEAPLVVLADRTRVAQVVGNLLHNSAKFTPRGGATRVVLEADGAEAVVRVVDDGVGMDASALARVFQPFVQADQTIERSEGGLGLGLALVKGLVELHGGHVEARSEGVGRGAELVVRLPLEGGPAVLPAEAAPRVRTAPRRVLVIEDNQDAADTLRASLELAGHEVEIAYEGAEGVAKARALVPDLVLCDLGLPGLDGYEVAAALRADPALARTALVALSGYALPEDRERAARAGFDRHLAKPTNLDALEDVLADLPLRR
jgi:PAS domain S-box-containing protein